VEHRCEVVIEFQLIEAEEGFGNVGRSVPYEHCGKIAHFKTNLGSWMCAEHWDEHEKGCDLLKQCLTDEFSEHDFDPSDDDGDNTYYYEFG
jgi:hypothetical protein